MRPKLEIAKTVEQAAVGVDEMFNSAYQTTAGGPLLLDYALFLCLTSIEQLKTAVKTAMKKKEGKTMMWMMKRPKTLVKLNLRCTSIFSSHSFSD